jgi:hypothetical protein
LARAKKRQRSVSFLVDDASKRSKRNDGSVDVECRRLLLREALAQVDPTFKEALTAKNILSQLQRGLAAQKPCKETWAVKCLVSDLVQGGVDEGKYSRRSVGRLLVAPKQQKIRADSNTSDSGGILQLVIPRDKRKDAFSAQATHPSPRSLVHVFPLCRWHKRCASLRSAIASLWKRSMFRC